MMVAFVTGVLLGVVVTVFGVVIIATLAYRDKPDDAENWNDYL